MADEQAVVEVPEEGVVEVELDDAATPEPRED